MSSAEKNPNDPFSIEQIATDWVELVVAGKYDQAVKSFDNTMSAQVTAARLQDMWNAINTQFGEFKDIKGTKASPYGEYIIVFVTCNFNNGALDIQLTFDAGRKIAGLYFRPPT
jgi:hypothetical protein